MSYRTNITSLTIFGMVFSVLFHLHGGLIARNVGLGSSILAIIFFYLPIIYGVYHICHEHAKLPNYLQKLSMFTVSFLFINELYNFILDLAIIFGRESFAYGLWPFRLVPVLIWIGYTLIIGSINYQPMRKLFIFFLFAQLAMITIMIIDHSYNLLSGTVGTYYFIETKPYLLTMLNIAIPFSYLIFYNFRAADFKRPYLRAIIFSFAIMLILVGFSSGTVIDNSFNFENSYYLNSLYLNYPLLIAYLFAIFEAIIRLFIAGFIYTIVVLKLRETKTINYKRVSIINTLLVFLILHYLVFEVATDFSEVVSYQFQLGFFIQAVYVLVLVYYGFYVALRSYELTRIKLGLFVLPSFLVIYYIYNISKVWPGFGWIYMEFLNFVDNYLLIISILVMLYYTVETILLWYAYSRSQSTTDLPQTVVAQDYHIYIMIPCLNEELVIGNTLTSLLASNYQNLHIVVIDDASHDHTSSVVESFSDPRLSLIKRQLPNAQQGKGEALNYVYYQLRDQIASDGLDFNQVLITIIDADTLIPLNYFEKVNYVFNARRNLTGLQSKVRVLSTNSDKAQDLEFAEIINATQSWRSITNTVAFGGNGQFCKLTALEALAEAPWSTSLVEDFDLSTRLFLNPNVAAVHAQYSDIYIVQTGIDDDLEALVKQRVRWSQGNIQSGKYIGPILKSKTLQKRQKFELLMTLIKPWLMGLEYVIVIYTLVTIIDLLILTGMSPMIAMVIILFIAMLFYILAINLVWSVLYNRNKSDKLRVRTVLIDCYHLTKFLIVLAQIYPQSTIRYLKRENGWDKTKRK